MTADSQSEPIAEILATPDLAQALADDRFKQFLDHVPVAIAVSELHPSETITYANLEFEALTGLAVADIIGGDWTLLPGISAGPGQPTDLGEAIDGGADYIGSFLIADPQQTIEVDAWSNSIEDEDGTPLFRLVALAARRTLGGALDPRKELREKAALLMELQHRVKNNLQIITTLIRMEARSIPDDETGARFERLAGRVSALALLETGARFERLAGRVSALALLYKALSGEGLAETVDLGAYLSQVASSVMAAHAVEGLRLELKVDSWPVSINVAMPAGLVVNELMTNALKHAFEGRKGGVISLTSVVDKTGCRVTVADDGVGLPEGTTWPTEGRLGAVIARSLRENAKAVLDVVSKPGKGVHVTIFFARTAAQKSA